MTHTRTPNPIMGFLARLRRDERGNTLAIMAAMMIPLAAFSGSAVDMGRLYAVKSRLQQACDAGALAGRKFMTDTTSSTLDSTATAQAQAFFTNNFRSGWFKASSVTFTPSKTSDNQVAGVASASVPMAIMSMFGMGAKTVSVNCKARYDVADADIVFVLDTTGSMACTTADDPCGAASRSYTRSDGSTGYYDVEESGSKISGLRAAVLSFYDTVAASADSSTHIRYGFAPYTSTVNVGALIRAVSSSYLVTQWKYQTRHAVGDQQLGNGLTVVVSASTATDCTAKAGRTPALTTTTKGDGTVVTNYTYTTSGTATVLSNLVWAKVNNVSTCTGTQTTYIPIWRYQQWPLDVSQYITGAAVDDPTKVTAATSTWQGCIEETNTTASSSFDANNLPADLNPDLIPTASVDANGFPTSSDTRWRPMWPDATYYRGANMSYVDHTGSYTSPYGDDNPNNLNATDPYSYLSFADNLSAGYHSCGMAAQRLTVMTRDQVSAYVNANDFRPIGGTYHDTGMIWGTRLISPNGIFKNDTLSWPGRPPPNRYIVFMTDGEMSPNKNIYGMYGMEYYDGRVTGSTGSSYSSTNDLNYHNARFLAECQAAKNRNITVFVVGFGQSLNSQLTSCASAGQAFYASDNASLKTAFQKIAQQVAMLRISQ